MLFSLKIFVGHTLESVSPKTWTIFEILTFSNFSSMFVCKVRLSALDNQVRDAITRHIGRNSKIKNYYGVADSYSKRDLIMMTKMTWQTFCISVCLTPMGQIGTGCTMIYFVCGDQFSSYENEYSRNSTPTPFSTMG